MIIAANKPTETPSAHISFFLPCFTAEVTVFEFDRTAHNNSKSEPRLVSQVTDASA